MDYSMPGFPVLHSLLEFAQIHVPWASDAIQPSHPLSSPSPPAFNLSQHQGLFQWISCSHQMASVLEFQLQHQSFSEYSGLISFRIDWFELLAVQGTLRSLLSTTIRRDMIGIENICWTNELKISEVCLSHSKMHHGHSSVLSSTFVLWLHSTVHFPFSLSCIGEGNGNPLQCSCLENPRDGGAWWNALYGVAQSRTQLMWLSSSSSSTVQGLPWWLSGKEPTWQCRRRGFDPCVGKIPWRRKCHLTLVFLPGKSHGQRSLAGYGPWGCKSQTWFSNYTTVFHRILFVCTVVK